MEHLDDNDDQPSLMLVDDDDSLREVLGRALARRGFVVTEAASAEEACELAETHQPEYAVVDLKLPGASGLEVVRQMVGLDAGTRIVVLTGYASIATAVESIKLGAVHYLAKPANTDEIVSALGRQKGVAEIPIASAHLSVGRLEWEHIQKVLTENDGNISKTARALSMHRRTLQRKLLKRPPHAA